MRRHRCRISRVFEKEAPDTDVDDTVDEDPDENAENRTWEGPANEPTLSTEPLTLRFMDPSIAAVADLESAATDLELPRVLIRASGRRSTSIVIHIRMVDSNSKLTSLIEKVYKVLSCGRFCLSKKIEGPVQWSKALM